MENAQIFYENLLKNGQSEIDRLITENAHEHYFLDFKVKSDDRVEPADDIDKKNLAKALSGFANSQGGLLIWGVEKKDGKPMRYKLVKSPHAFIESLNRAVSQVVTPFVDAADSKLVFQNSDSEGVVVTYIPRSEKTPHRSLKDRSYYMRSGDSFLSMEHSQLEDMFGRRNRPKLHVIVKAHMYSESRPAATYSLDITLKNEGRAISQHFGFDLEFPAKVLDYSAPWHDRPSFVDRSSELGPIRYRNHHDMEKTPIYPGETIKIATNNYRLSYIHFQLTKNQFEAWKDTILHYSVYSENMMTQSGEMRFGDLFSTPPTY
ncbi:MAG: ATP-binding protein [Patescibacteria group bacterium]